MAFNGRTLTTFGKFCEGKKYKTAKQKQIKRMHWPGIEPGPPAWQARILPLNHQCSDGKFWLTSK